MTEEIGQREEQEWRIIIRACDNGFIVEWREGAGDGTLIPHSMVFEEEDSETGGLDAMCELLQFIKEHFGVYWSKHNKHNLEIEVRKTNS